MSIETYEQATELLKEIKKHEEKLFFLKKFTPSYNSLPSNVEIINQQEQDDMQKEKIETEEIIDSLYQKFYSL